MNSLRTVAWPFYLTALLIVLFPAMEFVLTVWPWSPSVLSWRYGSVGLLTRTLMTPMVGVALLTGTAVALGHKPVLWVVAAVGFLGAPALIMVMGMFALDVVDFRVIVQEEASLAFDTSSAVVLMKLLAVSVVLLAFGISALRSLRSTQKSTKQRKKNQSTRDDPARLMAFRSSGTGESGTKKVEDQA